MRGRGESAQRSYAAARAAGRTLGLALLLLGLGCGADPKPPAARPHILLLTLDTTRADHLGFHGHTRDTSPNLDALAREGVVYTRAYATSSWTLPSHASLFTGKFTASHGARYDPEGPLHLIDVLENRPSAANFRARGLPPHERTLAAILAEAGFETAAVVAGPWMKRVFGLDAGFAHYDDRDITHLDGRPAARVTDAALAWLDSRSASPFFLFLNYYDPHGPYRPPLEFLHALEPEAERIVHRRLDDVELGLHYDAEIRAMDHHLGRLFEGLRARGLYEDTWILVTADHGELLGEHGKRGHGKYLTQPELHIPLLVKPAGPRRPARRVDTPVQLVDILPWITRELGLERPPGIQGEAPPDPAHPVVAEAYPLHAASPDGHWRVLFEGPWKFVWSSRGHHALFDLAADPGEQRNRIPAEPQRAREMHERLERYLESLPAPGKARAAEVDAETREALESLGYIE